MTDLLPPACVVRGLSEARIAITPGRPVTLLSARGAGLFAGVLFWRALVRAACDEARGPVLDILDCADAPARALEAVRLGQRLLVLAPESVGFADVAARAASLGASILPARPASLDCSRRGASRRVLAWLDGHDRGGASV